LRWKKDRVDLLVNGNDYGRMIIYGARPMGCAFCMAQGETKESRNIGGGLIWNIVDNTTEK